jgi:eukaryotic-like serine/threonine-protein kinase
MAQPSLQKVEQLFHAAADLTPDRRAAFLDEQCAGEPELRAAVEALLAQDAAGHDSPSFLGSPILRTGTDAPTLRAEPGEAGPPRDLTSVPGYELFGEIGRGGMGVVYKARQLGLNRYVALKMLLADPGMAPTQLARFRGEAEALARLHHPNIVEIYEVGEHDGRPYFAMEYVAGPSLASRVDGTSWAPADAAALLETLARALDAVHECGIIHRDLKPSNVLLAPDGTPKIADFGLAKDRRAAKGLTRSGVAMGTPSYMAPEQARGEVARVGPATDLYALGAILYELLTGRPPFDEATPPDTIAKLLAVDPVSPAKRRPGLPRDLVTICLKCLAKDPAERYGSALDLADDLRRFQSGEPITARPAGLAERAWRWCRRQPVVAGLLALTAVLAVALTITGLLLYNARLQQKLRSTEDQAEERREQVVNLTVTIAVGYGNEGEAFLALLYLVKALELDEGYPERLDQHRERIQALLRGAPRLVQLWNHEDPVVCVRFTAAGCRAVTADTTGGVRVWDALSGEAVGRELSGPAAVVQAEVSPDGRLLATADAAGCVRVWEPGAASQRTPPLAQGKPVRRLVFHPGGRILFAERDDGRVQLWDTTNGERILLPGLEGGREPPATVSEDGRWVFALDRAGTGHAWEVGSDKGPPLRLEAGSAVREARFSPDGARLALVGSDHTVSVWDRATGKLIGGPCPHDQPVRHVVFLAARDEVVTVDAERTVRRWRLGPGAARSFPVGRAGAVHAVQTSPDGRWVLTRLERGARLWDAATDTPRTPTLDHTVPVTRAVFSPDSRRLVLADEDRTVRVWALEDAGPHPGRSAEQLAALARVLTGHRLNEHGVPTALDRETVADAWNKVCADSREANRAVVSP